MKIKFLLTYVLFSATLLSTNVNAQNNNDNKDRLTLTSVYSDDHGFKGKSDIEFTEDGHRYRLKLNGKNVEEMYVDGEKVAKENFSKYDSLVKQVIKRMEEQIAEAEKHRAEAEVHRQQADKHRAEAAVHRQAAEKHRAETEMHRKEAEKQRESAEKFRAEADDVRKQADLHREQADKHRAEAAVHREEAEKHRAEADVHRKEAEAHRKLMEELIDDILKEKIISDRDDLRNVTLDTDEFIVNDKKQSNELHQRFKGKYLKNNEKFNLRFSNNSKTISIQ